MFTNGHSAEVKLQIVGERGLKIVAQTLARTRYKLRQYPQPLRSAAVLVVVVGLVPVTR